MTPLKFVADTSNTQPNLTDWLGVAASALGVVVTVIYVFLTYRIVRLNRELTTATFRSAEAAREGAMASLAAVQESRLQRRVSTEPLLAAEQADASWYGDTLQSLAVRVKNYGDGPAFSVDCEIAMAGANAQRHVPGGPVLASQTIEFDFDQRTVGWRVNGTSSATIQVSCRDIYGSAHSWVQECVLTDGVAKAQIATWPSASASPPEP